MFYLGAQPGTSAMNGGPWEATVEGTQNFVNFSDHGDIAQDSEEFPYHMDNLEDFPQQNSWTAMSSVASSVAMQRTVSRSSADSFKNRTLRPSSHKARPRLQTDLTQGSHANSLSACASTSGYDITGDAVYSNGALVSAMSAMPATSSIPQTYFQDSSASSNSRMLDMQQQYLSVYPQSLAATTMGADGLGYSTDLGSALAQPVQQHVDPTCTQVHMDFETSPGVSPHTWLSSSSRNSSPDLKGEDAWSLPVASSPAESHDSAVSYFAPQMDSDDNLSMGFQQRSNSDSESARDHHLYRKPPTHPDGLYHCPWEGETSCNHKPEKLKCNYDKYVDSHLKPYRCKHTSCANARFSSTACLLRHEREAHAMHGHGDKPFLCTYEGCERSLPGYGFPRQWNLKDHMRRVHHDAGSQSAMQPAGVASGAAGGALSSSATSSSQGVVKGRKRKSSGGISSASASRKSSSSKGHSKSSQQSAAAAENKNSSSSSSSKAGTQSIFDQAAYQDWCGHKKALTDIVMGFTQPFDAQISGQIQDAQVHLSALNQISTTMLGSSADVFQGAYGQRFSQQSG